MLKSVVGGDGIYILWGIIRLKLYYHITSVHGIYTRQPDVSGMKFNRGWGNVD